MKVINDFVEKIKGELCGAQEYAELYLYEKAKGSNRASSYKNLAQDELNHATALHQYAIEDIEELQRTYTPPAEMQERWQKAHKEYAEKAAFIKQMLAL